MAKRLELANCKFGRLTVTAEFESRNGRVYWLCECECGNQKWTSSKLLQNGEAKSCGCLRKHGVSIDLSGETFGRLTVLDSYEIKPRKTASLGSRTYWECQCECGKRVWVEASTLKTSTSSCGCLRLEKISLPHGEAAKRKVYRKYQWSADKRDLQFELSFDELIKLCEDKCYYCGCQPSQISNKGSLTGEFVYNGIDRIDSNSDYNLENVVTCCKTCNYAKGPMEQVKFLQTVEKIYTNRIIDIEAKRRCVFLGRWQPMHDGHIALIRTQLDQGKPCLVLVRATPVDSKNPFTLIETIEMVRAAFKGEDVKVMPIYDVEGVYYGRKVGYNVEAIDMPDNIKRISATDIRNRIQSGDESWRDFVNPHVAEWLEKYYDR